MKDVKFNDMEQNIADLYASMEFDRFLTKDKYFFKEMIAASEQQNNILKNSFKMSIVTSLNKLQGQYEQQAMAQDRYDFVDTFRSKDDLIDRRSFELNDKCIGIIKQRIAKYTEWFYPGLILFPSDVRLTQNFVAMEPMYLADVFTDVIDKHLEPFQQVYRDKTPTYKIDYYNHNLDMLPQEQFGFIMCVNTFPFFHKDLVEKYLTGIFALLRPGGTLLFNYANCDLPNICSRFEDGNYLSYHNEHIMEETYKRIGYEHIYDFVVDPYLQFLEIKKPGEIKSIKTKSTYTMAKNNF